MRGLGMLAVLPLLSACAALPQKPANLYGEWGGDHIALSVEGGLGRLSYDCAQGTIDQAIVPGPDGNFSASGTHIPGQGGPIQVGQIFTTHKAEYRGNVQGDTMQLRTILDDGTVLGPFSLTLGQPPNLLRCL